jgi:hypothetical protein
MMNREEEAHALARREYITHESSGISDTKTQYQRSTRPFILIYKTPGTFMYVYCT